DDRGGAHPRRLLDRARRRRAGALAQRQRRFGRRGARGGARRREARRADGCRRALPRLAGPRLARLAHHARRARRTAARPRVGHDPQDDGVPRGRRRGSAEGRHHRRPPPALDPARDLHGRRNRHRGGSRMSSVDHGEVFSRVMMKSAPAPLAVLARGEGARVWDVDGKGYLDFLAGIAVNALGHAHPAFVDAVSGQAARLAHVSNYFATEPQLELAERLTRLAGGDRVFLCNSGAEAIEAAFKLSRLTGRTRVLALENGFHGRTMGSLSLTGKAALRDPFAPLVPGVEHLDSTIEALEEALAPGDVAAL